MDQKFNSKVNNNVSDLKEKLINLYAIKHAYLALEELSKEADVRKVVELREAGRYDDLTDEDYKKADIASDQATDRAILRLIRIMLDHGMSTNQIALYFNWDLEKTQKMIANATQL